MKKLLRLPVNRYVDYGLFLVLALFPLSGSLFYTQLIEKYLVFLIFAYSLDILWGYAGLMNLGHAVLFGLGGYVMALSLSARGGIPDFMANGGVTQMPGWLQVLSNPAAAVLAGILLPALLAGLLGRFLFYSRVGGVFFAVITLALAQVFNLFIQSQQTYTGGFNGIGGLPGLSLFGNELTLTQGYYFVFCVVVLAYVFCRCLMGSRFGLVLRGIRENETRLEFLGCDQARFKTAVFAVSGALAGLAGVLYAPVNGMIAPNDVGMEFSTAVIVWLAIGGRGNLTGAAVGAMLVNVLGNALSENFGVFWQLLLGAVIVAVVFFVPDGIVGALIRAARGRKAGKAVESRG
ncbi:MAG: urea ABC transporter permease subunit UrtC [Oscillospiraceae bacterium]|jgi:urea transport system permease protein|nr:urea ABC transporter permease subunit UrtC [Oscillospiraceae bacterium]MCI2035501.1 urea ABC transporter permease subunit UrtC [Oscillospiraceae bacterium]